MRSRVIETYKASLKLNQLQQEVLIGLMLGDGHLEHSPCTERARLKIEQRAAALPYVEWLYQVYKELVRGEICNKTQYLKTTGKYYEKYYFTTYTHELLNEFHKQFYQEKIKVVPKNIVELLSPIGLAVWFMDDGSIKSHESRGRILNTHAFNKGEIELLCFVLKNKYNLDAKPRFQKDGIQIYISGNSAEIFQEIISPHIIPMMRYKLPLGLTNVPKL